MAEKGYAKIADTYTQWVGGSLVNTTVYENGSSFSTMLIGPLRDRDWTLRDKRTLETKAEESKP